jgi:hypothetical protein
MGHTVEIPGGTAVLREPAELKVKHRRLIETTAMAASAVIAKLPADATDQTAFADLSLTRSEATALMEMQDATIVALLDSWTLPQPLPNLDTVGELDTAVYDALAQATRSLGAEVAQGVSFTPSEDPASPTSGATDSDGSSKAEVAPMSTQPQPSGGESTSTESSTAA